MLIGLTPRRHGATTWDPNKNNLNNSVGGGGNSVVTGVTAGGVYCTTLATNPHTSGKYACSMIANTGDCFFGFYGAITPNTWQQTHYIGQITPGVGDGIGYETFNGSIRFNYNTNPPGNGGNPSGTLSAPANTLILCLFDIDNGVITFWNVGSAAVAATYTLDPAIIGNSELWYPACSTLQNGDTITGHFSGITLPPAYSTYNNFW